MKHLLLSLLCVTIILHFGCGIKAKDMPVPVEIPPETMVLISGNPA